MRLQLLTIAAVLVTTPATLRADDPICFLFSPTAPAPGYSGTATTAGTPGSVLDQCGTVPGAEAFALSHPALDHDGLWTGVVQQGFGFWVGTRALMTFRFFLGGALQFDTGLIKVHPAIESWWHWDGEWDQLEIIGAHLMVYDALDPLEVEPTLTVNDEGFLTPALAPGTDDVSVVPEPATLTLLATGLVGMAGASRRRRRKDQLD